MKKLWLVLPALVAINVFAQEVEPEIATEAPEAEVVVVAPTNTTALLGTVGYTYTKGDVVYASPLAQFQVEGVDDQSGLDQIFVSLDENGYAPYRGPISFTEEGPHSLIYKFIDKVGNISYSQIFNIYIDATAPRVLEPVFNPPVFKASGRNYVGPTNSITFKYFDDLVGTAAINYGIDPTLMSNYTDAFTPTTLGLTANTAFELVYQAVDAVSNVTVVKKTPLYLDAVAPVVNVFAKVYELDGVRYISSKEVIHVEAFDADTQVKEIKYAINDGEFTTYDPEIGIRITSAGEYDVKALAIDIVGNVSEEVLYSVVVDTLPPTGNAAYLGVGVTPETIPAEAGQKSPVVDLANQDFSAEDEAKFDDDTTRFDVEAARKQDEAAFNQNQQAGFDAEAARKQDEAAFNQNQQAEFDAEAARKQDEAAFEQNQQAEFDAEAARKQDEAAFEQNQQKEFDVEAARKQDEAQFDSQEVPSGTRAPAGTRTPATR